MISQISKIKKSAEYSLFLLGGSVYFAIGMLFYDEKYCPKENVGELLIIGGVILVIDQFIEYLDWKRVQQQPDKESTAEKGGVVTTPKQKRPMIFRILFVILTLTKFIWLNAVVNVAVALNV